jgi:Protein of unknown function (DUF5818)
MDFRIPSRIVQISSVAAATAVFALWTVIAAGAQQQKPPNPQLPDPNSQTQQQPGGPSPSPPAAQSSQGGSQVGAQENGQGPISSQTEQTFMGRIVKSKDGFVLKARSSGTTYKLDRQDIAKQYEGKDVRVTGTLDRSDETIRVSAIEPLTI